MNFLLPMIRFSTESRTYITSSKFNVTTNNGGYFTCSILNVNSNVIDTAQNLSKNTVLFFLCTWKFYSNSKQQICYKSYVCSKISTQLALGLVPSVSFTEFIY